MTQTVCDVERVKGYHPSAREWYNKMIFSRQDLPRHSRAPGSGRVQRSQGEELPSRAPLDHGRGQRLPGMHNSTIKLTSHA